MEEEMANRSAAGSRLIDRRTVLQVAAALAAAGPALTREGHAAARPPVVIDAQVHAYAANTPERPWHSVPNWPAHVTGISSSAMRHDFAHAPSGPHAAIAAMNSGAMRYASPAE
jgi:hypothetical protein